MSRRENPTSKFLKYYRSLDPAAREVVREMVADEIRVPKKKSTTPRKPASMRTKLDKAASNVDLGQVQHTAAQEA